MTFSPETTLAGLLAVDEAVSIVRRHRPDVLDRPEVELMPFLTLDQLLRLCQPFGEPAPDSTGMWEELANLSAGPVAPSRQAPAPPRADYESPQVERASGTVRTVSVAAQWDITEIVIDGPAHGNPFVDVALEALFQCDGDQIRVGGFYDGDGTYRLRFQPPSSGSWTFQTHSNAHSLDGLTGEFNVLPPSPGNRGRIVTRDTYHFAYQDGTPYLPLGTTAYAWTNQPADLEDTTLRALADSPFTKVRMCVFPKSYLFNSNEPPRYPYQRDSAGAWDFTTFDVTFFRHLEDRIRQLQEVGIEADVILFHSYDRWGFSQMPAWADDLYTSYLVRRLAAFRGVWWALANEYDFMTNKTHEDWERIAAVIQHEDHVGHLTSIHNGLEMYDHSRPWITHCSIQRIDTYRTAENVTEWRERYRKAVVVDECGYEGDIDQGWGNISGQELVRRCWEGAVRGGYVNHGETYYADDEVIWWAKGGLLRGESPPRIGFLARIIGETPSGRFDPLPGEWDAPCGGDDDHRIMYLGFGRPAFRRIQTAPGTRWNVDVIDTWNMTVRALPGTFMGLFTIDLPGREFMAIRLRRAKNHPG